MEGFDGDAGPNHTVIRIISGCFDDMADEDLYVLSDGERERAMSIKHVFNRQRYIATRVFLRRAIGCALASELPYRGDFLMSAHGKPYLPLPYARLNFNLSHTNEYITAVFVESEPVGVDIESSSRAISSHLLDYAFRPNEVGRILLADDWRTAFLQGWTMKEAVLKCIGCGFQRDPKIINVPFQEDNRGRWTAHEFTEGGGGVNGAYRLIPFTYLQGIIGAVAIRDHSGGLSLVRCELKSVM